MARFNDVITHEAFAGGLPLVDLCLVRSEDADFTNLIEPFARGGATIARAIAEFVTGHAFVRVASGCWGQDHPRPRAK